MTPDSIFSICNTIAFISWLILLIGSPFWKNTDKFLVGIVVTLLAIVYAWCISQSFKIDDFNNFSTLDGLMGLFSSKMAVTAGWVHYLAFDLMTGIWIRNNSIQHGIRYALVIPCMIFTFMMGPVGLLMYLVLRVGWTKKYFSENYQIQ